jgi:hypothetical protein
VLRAEDERADVHRVRAVEVVELELLDGLERRGGGVADVVVDAPVLVGGRGEEALDVRRVLHVGLDGDRPPARLLHGADGLGGEVRVALEVDDHRGALAGELHRERAADAARAARDERDLAGREAAHDPCPARIERAMIVFWISFVPSSKRWARASR